MQNTINMTLGHLHQIHQESLKTNKQTNNKDKNKQKTVPIPIHDHRIIISKGQRFFQLLRGNSYAHYENHSSLI